MKVKTLIQLLEDLDREDAEVHAGPQVGSATRVTGVWVTNGDTVVLATPEN